MKRYWPVLFFLAAQPVTAADLPSRKEPIYVEAVPVFTWTGFYVGADLGAGWTTDKERAAWAITRQRLPVTTLAAPVAVVDPLKQIFTPFDRSTTGAGVTAGLHIGYNYQFFPGNFLLGVELSGHGMAMTSAAASSVNWNGIANAVGAGGGIGNILGANCLANCLAETRTTQWRGFVAAEAKAGIAGGRWAFWLRGGAVDANIRTTDSTILITRNVDRWRPGWTAGASLHYAFTPNIIVGLTERYLRVGDRTTVLPFVNTPALSIIQTARDRASLWLTSLSVDYKF